MDLRDVQDNLEGLAMKFEAAESMLSMEPPIEQPAHRDPLRAPETDQVAAILRHVLTLKKDHTAKMEYLMEIEDKYAVCCFPFIILLVVGCNVFLLVFWFKLNKKKPTES